MTPADAPVEVLTRPFGGGALARAALDGTVPHDWYAEVPRDAAVWTAAARGVAEEFAGGAWLARLAPAFDAKGSASERLERAATGGVVVTTGQQPGLFGGPIYTWSKALTALALADELERVTGLPVAPVFWAATDDSDFVEASTTAVAHDGEVRVLSMAPAAVSGRSMAAMPLGDVREQFRQLTVAAGSGVDPRPLDVARAAYADGETVGGAYVHLLRAMFEPLGIAVLDAAHAAVRRAGAPTIREALALAPAVRGALAERSRAVEDAGYRVQVQPVANLSLVFRGDGDGRVRVPLKAAAAILAEAPDEALGPNVLLRPVVERQILPTVTYVAGPGELAYFAQVTAVADALRLARPRVVPRWSGVILEPHVRDILAAVGATVEDFADPHAVESRVAREELPVEVRGALASLRGAVRVHTEPLRGSHEVFPGLQKVVVGFEAQVEHRIARLERRYAAAVKRTGSVRLHDVAVARASLFPLGRPQERVLNMLPFLARYGAVVCDAMRDRAGEHAAALVSRG